MIPHGTMDYRPPEENDLKSVIEQRNRYLIERDEAVAKLAEAKKLAKEALDKYCDDPVKERLKEILAL